MININIAKKSDLKEFAKLRFLAHKYSAKFDKDIIISADTQQKLAKLTEKEFEDPRITYLIVRGGRELVGIAILSLAKGIDKSAFLGELFIKEKYRHEGVGKELIEEIMKIVNKQGINSLKVTVSFSNREAQNFYSNFGFHRKKRRYVLLEKRL